MPQVSSNPLMDIMRNKPSMIGSIDVAPDIAFENQNPGEKVFIKARAHPIVNFGWVLNVSFMAVLPLLAYVGYQYIPFNFDLLDYVPIYTIGVMLLMYYSVVYTNAFFSFIDWYFDLYLVTDHRIINIQFEPLKDHKITESKLADIEHIEESVVGLFPQIFNYGDLKVSTAARRGLFYLRSVPRPAWFRNILTDLSNYLRRYR